VRFAARLNVEVDLVFRLALGTSLPLTRDTDLDDNVTDLAADRGVTDADTDPALRLVTGEGLPLTFFCFEEDARDVLEKGLPTIPLLISFDEVLMRVDFVVETFFLSIGMCADDERAAVFLSMHPVYPQRTNLKDNKRLNLWTTTRQPLSKIKVVVEQEIHKGQMP
jgi:hypothetical protein